MRILMACMKFPTAPGQSYLTTELAQALVAAGHQVEVLLIDWDATAGAPDGPGPDGEGVRVVRCTPRLISGLGGLVRNASKFVLTGRRARRLAREHFDLERFDVFIAWTPALAFGPCVGLAHEAGDPRRILFIWDFFPDHYHEIGRIPGGPALWFARLLEQRLMDRFNLLFCTLPQNARYLRRQFRVRRDQTVGVAPIWSDVAPIPDADRSTVRRRHDLAEDRPIAIFGGQMVEGRGFDQMLAAAAVGREKGSPLLFLFNVLWRPAMPRDDYLQLLTACDVGMIATVAGVSSFTIPSKTLDYLRAGLPVVAALETGNDFSALLERYGVGRAVAFGDPEGFFATAEALAAGPSVAAAAQLCLDEVFHVRHTVASIMADI
jgi:hypothetical protein